MSKTENKAEENTTMPMAISMKVNGKTISNTASESCSIPMETAIKDSGTKEKNTDMELTSIAQAPYIEASSTTGRNMEQELSISAMAPKQKLCGSPIRLRGKVKYSTKTETFLKELSTILSKKDRGSTVGPTALDMRVFLGRI